MLAHTLLFQKRELPPALPGQPKRMKRGKHGVAGTFAGRQASESCVCVYVCVEECVRVGGVGYVYTQGREVETPQNGFVLANRRVYEVEKRRIVSFSCSFLSNSVYGAHGALPQLFLSKKIHKALSDAFVSASGISPRKVDYILYRQEGSV